MEQRDGIKCAHCSQVLLFIILEVSAEEFKNGRTRVGFQVPCLVREGHNFPLDGDVNPRPSNHTTETATFLCAPKVILETTYDFSGRLETLPKTTHMLREVDFHL